jgi:hypothetical protein
VYAVSFLYSSLIKQSANKQTLYFKGGIYMAKKNDQKWADILSEFMGEINSQSNIEKFGSIYTHTLNPNKPQKTDYNNVQKSEATLSNFIKAISSNNAYTDINKLSDVEGEMKGLVSVIIDKIDKNFKEATLDEKNTAMRELGHGLKIEDFMSDIDKIKHKIYNKNATSVNKVVNNLQAEIKAQKDSLITTGVTQDVIN